MNEYRTGQTDVIVPRALPDGQLDDYIRDAVQQELARTGEWPDRVEYQSGFGLNETHMRWPVTYTTGPFGQSTW